jgi:hypothetical protein
MDLTPGSSHLTCNLKRTHWFIHFSVPLDKNSFFKPGRQRSLCGDITSQCIIREQEIATKGYVLRTGRYYGCEVTEAPRWKRKNQSLSQAGSTQPCCVGSLLALSFRSSSQQFQRQCSESSPFTQMAVYGLSAHCPGTINLPAVDELDVWSASSCSTGPCLAAFNEPFHWGARDRLVQWVRVLVQAGTALGCVLAFPMPALQNSPMIACMHGFFFPWIS